MSVHRQARLADRDAAAPDGSPKARAGRRPWRWPLLAAVKAYADSHFFRHFQDFGKTLGIGTGFWVNR